MVGPLRLIFEKRLKQLTPVCNDYDHRSPVIPLSVYNHDWRNGPRSHVWWALSQIFPFRSKARIAVEHPNSAFDSLGNL
jgi:hypothetical protein